MKQCPNPNCMLYTRLEELPDAYMKCPGCDGPLVAASGQTAAHASTFLTGDPAQHYGRPAHAYEPTLGNRVPPTDPYAYPDEIAYADEYAYGDEESDGFAPAQPRGSRLSRMAFAGAILLLAMVLACGVGAMVFGGRVFSKSRTASGPEATETALSYMYPAVNTPIPIMPTLSSPGGLPVQPSTGSSQATSPPVAPTLPPAQPAATAPPAQPQPGGGVLSARMSVRFEGGQPVGVTSVYKTGDTLNLAVQANFGPGAVTSVLTRWYGPGNVQIYEMRKDYTAAGTYYGGFTLKNAAGWAPGDYRVDVHPNNSAVPAYSVSFRVEP
ncbi:MAG TPA: hypothetical protein VM409_00300 [Chloroflexia bacterium]|nr:hypothetical protein [Chloroflexia bacterium]